jgi:excinuclease UvrABC nuclease subunit
MPFHNTNVYHFNAVTINTINEVGGVYGLAKALLSNPGRYTILYVGKSVNLRKRLQDHLNNPPVAGITHFFADRVDTEAGRTQREEELVAEFKPVGNTQLK